MALHGVKAVASKLLECKRTVEIYTTPKVTGVVRLRVLHPHHESCHKYADQRPFDKEMKEWMTGIIGSTHTYEQVLNILDYFLLKRCPFEEIVKLSDTSGAINEFSIKPPPLPVDYRLDSFDSRTEDTRFFPTKAQLKNWKAGIAKEWHLAKGDSENTYAHLKLESGNLPDGSTALIDKTVPIAAQRCLYYQQQRCGCTNAGGQGIKACTRGATCRPFLCILQVCARCVCNFVCAAYCSLCHSCSCCRIRGSVLCLKNTELPTKLCSATRRTRSCVPSSACT